MPMRLGKYFTIQEFAKRLGVSIIRAREIIQSEDVKIERFGRTPAIPERELIRVEQVRAERRVLPARKAREVLLQAGFIYVRRPPEGTESGRPHYPGPWRRGWWAPTESADDGSPRRDTQAEWDGRLYEYYGLTALEALQRFFKQV